MTGGDLPTRFADYELGRWSPQRRRTHEVAANYKLIGENFMEYYPCRLSIGRVRRGASPPPDGGRGERQRSFLPVLPQQPTLVRIESRERIRMIEVSIVGPGQGELVLSTPSVEMRILEDGSTTEHRLGLAEIVLAPHAPGPPQHRHAHHDEGFYVVSGCVRFTVGQDVRDVGPGSLVMIPTGAPHTFENAGDEAATVINTFTPDLYVQYFRDLREMLASGEPHTAEDVVAVMSRYATEPATTYAPSATRG